MTALTHTTPEQLNAAWDDGEITEQEYRAEMFRFGYSDDPPPAEEDEVDGVRDVFRWMVTALILAALFGIVGIVIELEAGLKSTVLP